jgi:hypothetical protein
MDQRQPTVTTGAPGVIAISTTQVILTLCKGRGAQSPRRTRQLSPRTLSPLVNPTVSCELGIRGIVELLAVQFFATPAREAKSLLEETSECKETNEVGAILRLASPASLN